MASESITRRHLPHWFVPGAYFFVTYRLDGTIPRAVLDGNLADSAQVKGCIARTRRHAGVRTTVIAPAAGTSTTNSAPESCTGSFVVAVQPP